MNAKLFISQRSVNSSAVYFYYIVNLVSCSHALNSGQGL